MATYGDWGEWDSKRGTYFLVQVTEDGDYILHKSGVNKYKAVRQLRKLRKAYPEETFFACFMTLSRYIEEQIKRLELKDRRSGKPILIGRDDEPPF